MSISNKLNALLVISFIAIAFLIGISQFQMFETKSLQKQIQTIEILRSNLLGMRKNEKDFFTYKDLQYSEQHLQEFNLFQKNLKEMRPEIVGETNQLAEFAAEYNALFDESVELTKTIGLTPKTGLYGKLRAAVHDVERKLKPLNTFTAGSQLLVEMLMLRRHEKDFMLRRDAKYAKRITSRVKKFKEMLNASILGEGAIKNINNSIDIYQKSFSSLFSKEKLMGIANEPGLKEKLEQQAMLLEDSLNQSLKIAGKNALAFEQKITWIYISVTAALALLLIGMLLQTRRSVLQPIKLLMTQMQTITQTGNLKKRIEVISKDEFGTISQEFNSMLNNISQAVDDTNIVMNQIANGQLYNVIKNRYPGDLGEMTDNINLSSEAIQKTIGQIELAMEAIYEGNFDYKLSSEAPGQYGRILVKAEGSINALNTIIDEINHSMGQVTLGKFDARVTVAALGSLETLKNNVNMSMDNLEKVIDEISEVIISQSNGDLSKQLPSGGFKGQLFELESAINQSSVKLNEVVSVAVNASNVVSGAAQEVSQGSRDLSQSVQEQAAALEETSATMNQMNAQVQSSSENAQQANRIAQKVGENASQGVSIMQNTIQAMSSIEESSHKIADIVTLIDSIAFQTNLLALNAAVEAARAGDHGRGFAVVAGEVRNLAQKSAEAAREIKQLIDETVERVNQGSQLADQSGKMLNTINESVEEVNTMIREIADAAKEQAEGVNQVHQAISQIDGVTQQNAALVEETSSASESLSHQAEVLRREMGFFQTTSHPQGVTQVGVSQSGSSTKAAEVPRLPGAVA